MASFIKVFLLLAVMVCISKAQLNESENQCLCQRVRANLIGKSPVKDIQIYPATIFCDRVEIVKKTMLFIDLITCRGRVVGGPRAGWECTDPQP
uniref:Chemokine interleukin-8-like domain-containing protein n=1 Tax=Monopterus albus TaxID=43700 RepID=A0A3Q3JLW0_MONAL